MNSETNSGVSESEIIEIALDDPEKQDAELKSLRSVRDSFKKIVVSKSYGKSWVDDEGILRINVIDFLLDTDSLKR